MHLMQMLWLPHRSHCCQSPAGAAFFHSFYLAYRPQCFILLWVTRLEPSVRPTDETSLCFFCLFSALSFSSGAAELPGLRDGLSDVSLSSQALGRHFMMLLISSQSPLTPQHISSLLCSILLSFSSFYHSLITCRDLGANTFIGTATWASWTHFRHLGRGHAPWWNSQRKKKHMSN